MFRGWKQRKIIEGRSILLACFIKCQMDYKGVDYPFYVGTPRVERAIVPIKYD